MIHDNESFIFDASNLLKYSRTVCQDQKISYIKYELSNDKFCSQDEEQLDMQVKGETANFFRERIDYSKPSSEFPNNIIVLLLESPSNDEYTAQDCFGTTAPCWGTTGINIKRHFLSIINSNISPIKNVLNLTDGERFELVAVNAIRYQCDLGNPGGGNNTKNIFMSLWNNFGFEDDLFERLKKIKPILIINCCTRKISKAAKLTSWLKQKNKGTMVLECSKHPSLWFNSKGITLS